jgi:cellulose synthase/poly-beta-1,6-N-acetylglucosamine synthase-like glycosyltransferase
MLGVLTWSNMALAAFPLIVALCCLCYKTPTFADISASGVKKVNIIMPIYNEEENLIATLDSISRFKTNRSVELLLINNNSSDN